MPNPKKRHTHSRTRLRRSQWRVDPPNITICPQCGHSKIPHRVCPNCGFYKGEMLVVKKEKEKEGK